MPTDEVIENKDEFEENTAVTGDGTDDQIAADKGSADELEQESEQTGSDDGDVSSAPSPDPLPDTDGDEPSEATVESEPDSDAEPADTHRAGESEIDDGGSAEDARDGDGVDEDTVDTAEEESDSGTPPDGEVAKDGSSESESVADGSDEAERSDEPAGDGDTDTDGEAESADDGSRDDTDTDDSDTVGDVVIEADVHVTVPIDLSNVDEGDGKLVPLRDGIHSEYDDIDRKSRVPRAVKIAAGTIATVAVAAALVTSTAAVMVVEIHPSVIGGETIASQQAGGIDGSGKKITASYTVGDALHSSDSDGPEILSWTDRWYAVAPGAKSVRAEIESAGKGSRIDLSDGTSIDVDGRYASRAGSFDAGIDIAGIDKLYGGDDSWVAIRYDASHVLVGKRVAGGEGGVE